jgi:alpha-beta hydrolase superfamily lysophospholipase/phosphatidylglycerophosphate synthase
MSLYQLKSQFQDQLRPFSNALVRHGFTANQVTVSAVVLSASTAYVISAQAAVDLQKNTPMPTNIVGQSTAIALSNSENKLATAKLVWLILPTALFARMALNAIDGMMAREHNQASRLGALLNEAGDIVADTLLIASLQPHLANIIPQKNTHQLTIVNGLSTLTELIAISADKFTGQRANHGPLGKSDRALELGIIGTLVSLGVPIYRVTQPLLLLNQLLLIKTSLNRLRFIAQKYFEIYHPAPIARTLNATSLLETAKTSAPSNTVLSSTLTTLPISLNNTLTSNNSNASKPLRHPASLPHLQGRLTMKNNNKAQDNTQAMQVKTTLETIIAEQSCFNAYDGTALYYRYWLTMPLADIAEHSEQKQVILLHRGHEHSGRLSELGESFAQAGYQVFAWDARGNGRSGGIKDHADSVTELERDLNDFVNLVIAQTGIAIEDTLIVASSIGAVLAAAWVHDYAPTIRGMILGTPAISIRLYIPLAIPALKFARKLGLMSRVSSYVKAQVLTHDKDAQAAYNADPLISGSISSDLLIDTHATGQRLLDDAAAITAPTFVLCAGKDYVVDKQAERDFYEQISAPNKRWQLYPDSFHAIFHETNKVDIFADCIDFANSLFAAPAVHVDLTEAHKNSPSKDKVDRLAIKPFNPNFALTRLAMQKFGHVSDAIATGLEHGFDSGSSLDKVYSNDPKGKNAFGKAVDKFYLSNIGWQGIRIRREHLLELARIAIAERQQAHFQAQTNSRAGSKQKLRVLDIASGNGYYVFDLLTEFANLNAELRDYDAHNIQVLSDKAAKLDMATRVQAIEKDAFDPSSYVTDVSCNSSATDKNASGFDTFDAFDLAIASGVFELFSDNALVSTAVSGIYDSLAEGGYFIYTNQPWHPEQEFISKTLNNHRGSSWVMRCRSQLEMDQLVTQAGFTKVDMRIDRFGIFTVSLAIKNTDTRAANPESVQPAAPAPTKGK